MKKLSIMAAMAALLFAGTTVESSAGISVTVGMQVTCTISVSFATISVSGGAPATGVTATGSGTFESVSTTPGPIASTSFKPVALAFSGNDPVYGNFNFAFDPSKTPPLTTATANQPLVDYPATVDVHAYVIGTVSSLPGTYTNTSPLHLRKTDVSSFNPFLTPHTFQVVSNVTFTSASPGGSTFTILAGTPVTIG